MKAPLWLYRASQPENDRAVALLVLLFSFGCLLGWFVVTWLMGSG